MKKYLISIISCFLLAFLVANAHQPRLIYDEVATFEKPILITNPTISQAFYGEFKNGTPQNFSVSLKKDTLFYLRVLVPDNKNASQEVSAMMISVNPPLSSIPLQVDGKKYEWKKMYEEFAGDNYLEGPEAEKTLRAGDYMIVVTSKDNIGKYVLVVGKIESFPLKEALGTIRDLPALKMVFFETSFFSIFAGIIGKALLGIILFIIILVLIIVWLIKRKNRR